MSIYGQAEFAAQYISDPNKDKEAGLAQLVRWIPGEIIALYGAAVVVFDDPPGSTTAMTVWVVCLILALILALLGGSPWDIGGNKTKRAGLIASTIFTLGAFALWSFTVPGSALYRWDAAADNPEIAVLAAVAGLAFGAITDGVLTWIKARVKP